MTVLHVPGPGDLARGVEGGGGRAEHHLGLVGLGQRGQEAQQPGGPAEAHQQDAGGIGVEGAGVADPLWPKIRRQRATTSWEVQPGLLVHHDQAVDLVRRRRAHLSWSSRPSPVATRPAAGIVVTRGSGASTSSTRLPATTAGSLAKASFGVRFIRTWRPIACCSWTRRSSSASAASSDSELR